VKRSCALQSSLADETLTELVTGLDSLPSLPAVYLEIIDELKSPQSSLARIGKIISKDIGMTAKILQLVNSAFFGLPQHISTPAQAATLLGVDTIKALALSVKIFDDHISPATEQLDVQRLWNHCSRVSVLAKKIAAIENLDKDNADDAFMAGILHDVGMLVFASNLPEQYSEVLQLTSQENYRLIDAERQVFKRTHADIGGYLMGLWGFSSSIIEAILYHHQPSASPVIVLGPLTMVHIANSLDSIQQSKEDVPVEAFLDMEYLNELGIADRIPVWRSVHEKMNRSKSSDE
jgi:HD-like signal output (HDOD) protein